MWYSCSFTSKFLQSESRVFTRLACNCSFLQDLDALAPDGAWSSLSDLPVRLQKFPAIWLRIWGLLYLAELSDLNGGWFRWEGKYFRKIFLGGFTSATRYSYDEEVLLGGKRKLKFSFYKTFFFSISQTITQAEYTQARCTQGTSSTNGRLILVVVGVTKVPIISFPTGRC